MPFDLSPVGGAGWQFFDDNGVPLAGGKIYTYQAGTTTPSPTYTSISGSTPHTNPIILNAGGRVPDAGEIWLIGGQSYKFILKTSTDVEIWSADNLSNAAPANQVQNFVGTGSQATFSLATAPNGENATQIYINGVYQQKNTYSLASNVLNFSEAPPVNSTIEVVYT
jgi:hypothetical protein